MMFWDQGRQSFRTWLHHQQGMLTSWSGRVESRLSWLIEPYARAMLWRASLNNYWKHFTDAVIWGFLIELVIHAAYDSSTVRNIQNWVFDKTLHVFSQRDKTDVGAFKLPVILAIDDIAQQSDRFGNDRPIKLEKITPLIGQAFDRGATHVMVDFTFDDETTSDAVSKELIALGTKYGELKAGAEIRHLYVARSTKPNVCTPQRTDTDTLRRSVWDLLPGADATNRPGLMIHSVFPHYIRDSDNIVRGWHLFGVTQDPKSNSLTMFPSPQLAYYAVLDVTKNFKATTATLAEELAKLPWLASAIQPDITLEKSQMTAAMTRGEFAYGEVQRLASQLKGQHLVKLCKDHGMAFGCSKGISQAQHQKTWDAIPFKEANELVNDAIRPLPRAQNCREVVKATLRNMGEPNVESGRMYNRIVYSMSPWSEDPLPGVSTGPKQWGYSLITPLEMLDSQQPATDWTGRLVAIGGVYASSGDWYQTPVGHTAGVFINVNAMQSMAKFGPISELPGYAKWTVNLAIIVVVAAVFAGLKPLTAAIACAAILLGSLSLFYDTLLTNGIWIEFGAPLLGINIHRFIDDFRSRRRENQALLAAEDNHLKALGLIKLLQDRIPGSAWQQIVGSEDIQSQQSSPDDLRDRSSKTRDNLK